LTGETVGATVDGMRKAELLEVIAQAEGVSLDQVIAVGDGANDLWMLGKAGLGIAFNAKPLVQEQVRLQEYLREVMMRFNQRYMHIGTDKNQPEKS
jgi:phosphoserine phosphatase